jgi:hypothetical protein
MSFNTVCQPQVVIQSSQYVKFGQIARPGQDGLSQALTMETGHIKAQDTFLARTLIRNQESIINALASQIKQDPHQAVSLLLSGPDATHVARYITRMLTNLPNYGQDFSYLGDDASSIEVNDEALQRLTKSLDKKTDAAILDNPEYGIPREMENKLTQLLDQVSLLIVTTHDPTLFHSRCPELAERIRGQVKLLC